MRRPPRLRIARITGLAAATVVAFLLMAGLAQALPNTAADNTGMVDFPGTGAGGNSVAVRTIQQFGGNVWVGGIFDEIDDANGNKVADASGMAVFDATSGTLQPGVHLPIVTDASGAPEVYDMSVGTDGLLYIAGNFDHVDGQSRNGAAAVDATTGVLAAFHPNAGAANSVLATPNAIYVGTSKLLSFQLNGSPTPGYTAPTVFIDASLRHHETLPQFRDIALYGSTLVAACQCDSLSDATGTRPVKMLVEIDAATGNWVDWRPQGFDDSSGPFGISILVHAYPTNGAPTIYIAAGGSDFTAAYDFNPTFQQGNPVGEQNVGIQRFKTDTSGSSQAIAWHQGTIVIGGHFDWTQSPTSGFCGDNGTPNTQCYHTPKIAALNATSGVVVLNGANPWNPGICCKYNGVWTLLTGNDGRTLHVGGEFTLVGGTWSGSGTNWNLIGPSNQQFYARLSGPAATAVPLTVEKSVSAGATGTVTSTPNGINCDTTCTSSGPTDFNLNASVTLTATPTAGNTFIGWSSAESGFTCPGTGTCSVTMDMTRTVVANFAPISFQLSVSKAGAGTGTVTSDVSGINCGTTCSSFFPQNTVVTLTATPGPNSSFTNAGAGWSGAGCSGTGTCVVTIDQARNVTATFVTTSHTLAVAFTGVGTGSVLSSPSGINCGTQSCVHSSHAYTVATVTLTASAPGGSVFNGWSGGGCSGLSLTCVVTMDANITVSLDFAAARNLTVTLAGAGGGTVTSVPAGLSCNPTCMKGFAMGSTVTLTATPDGTSVFTGWSGTGGCAGTGSCVLTMSGAKAATATFQPGLLLNVAPAGTGGGTITSDMGGINCGLVCSANYLSGTTVTLFPSSDVNSTFTGWNGDCGGTGSCVVTMSQARNVTASFTLVQRGLTVHVGGQGTVTDNPGPISCVGPTNTGTCSATYQHGTDVQLVAFPATNWNFTGWTGDCSGFDTTPNGDPICIASMTATRDVTATFEQISRSVNVTKAGSGTGTVTSDVAGIDCGDDCVEGYNQGASVVLTATNDPGSIFTGWSGSCTGPGTCNLTINAAKNVVATFELLHTLTVATDGSGTGNVTSDVGGINCPATNCVASNLTHNTHVILTAAPDPGMVLAAWSESGCSASSLTCDVTMDSDKTVTATFAPTVTLTVATDGDGGGTVTSPPGNEISCPGTCGHDFPQDASVTLHAAADGSSVFVGWSSGDNGFSCPGTGDCTVTMDQARSVTATFQSVFTLSVTKTGGGTGTVTSLSPNLGIDCGSTCQFGFQEGVSVTLHATPDANVTFTGWSSGDPGFSCSGTGDCMVTMDQARTVTATFLPMYTLTVTKSGTGTGTVTSLSPNLGINCGATCQFSFTQGTSVTLHAAPDANVTFAGWSGGGCSGTADCIVPMNSAQSVNAQFNGTPPPGCTGTLGDNDPCVRYNGWAGVLDTNASGGAYRTSATKSDKATWKSPASTSVTWFTYKGPDQGKAKVTIDGVNKGTFDQYAVTPAWTNRLFSGLSNQVHTVVVTVLGTKRTASTGTNVRLDKFAAGAVTAQESDPSIQYDTWKSTANVNVTGGTFRSSATNTASATVTFSGTSIEWITAKGKAYGKASVLVDGVPQGTIDFYQVANAWQVHLTYGGLSAGTHTLTIQVLGQKNASATSAKVLVDGFVIHS
jgi:uncharacterized repeat protein (TIGR02543 family)